LRPSKNASKKTIEKFTREIRKTSPRSKINLKSSVGCIECSPGKVFSQKSEMCIRKNGKAAKKQGLYSKAASDEKQKHSKGVRVKRPAPLKPKAVKTAKPKSSLLASLLNLSTTAPQPTKPPTPPPQTAKLPTPPPQPTKLPTPPPQTAKLPTPPPQTAKLPTPPPQTAKPPTPPPQTAKLPTPPPQPAKLPTPPPTKPLTTNFKTLCKPYFADRYVYLHGFRDIRLSAAIKECGGKPITSPMNNRNTIVIYWKDQPKTIFTYRMMISYADLVKKLNFSGLPVAL
jgi:hypothetical protein